MEDASSSVTAWTKKLLCSLVLRPHILQCLAHPMPDGSRVSRLWPGWVLSLRLCLRLSCAVFKHTQTRDVWVKVNCLWPQSELLGSAFYRLCYWHRSQSIHQSVCSNNMLCLAWLSTAPERWRYHHLQPGWQCPAWRHSWGAESPPVSTLLNKDSYCSYWMCSAKAKLWRVTWYL